MTFYFSFSFSFFLLILFAICPTLAIQHIYTNSTSSTNFSFSCDGVDADGICVFHLNTRTDTDTGANPADLPSNKKHLNCSQAIICAVNAEIDNSCRHCSIFPGTNTAVMNITSIGYKRSFQLSTIYAPGNNGNLTVYVEAVGGSDNRGILNYATIYSDSDTHSISVQCVNGGANSRISHCLRMTINATTAQSLSVTQTNADIYASRFYCPVQSMYYGADACYIDCLGSGDCREIDIHTAIGRPQDAEVVCDDNNNIACHGLRMFCNDGSDTLMHSNSQWQWSGTNCLNTLSPTSDPSTQPTTPTYSPFTASSTFFPSESVSPSVEPTNQPTHVQSQQALTTEMSTTTTTQSQQQTTTVKPQLLLPADDQQKLIVVLSGLQSVCLLNDMHLCTFLCNSCRDGISINYINVWWSNNFAILLLP